MSDGKNISKDEFLNDLEIKVISFAKILESNKHKHERALMSSESAIYGTYIKIFTFDELEEFNKILSFVLTYSPIGKKFSKIYIEKEIINILHKVLVDIASVSFELKAFYSDLINNSNDEWFIISELENIRLLNTTPFQLLDSTMKIINKLDLPFDEEEFEKIRGFDYVMKPCVYTIVKAGDVDKAKMLATRNFVLSFSLLRLYAPDFKPFLKGTLITGSRDLSSYNTKKKIIDSSSSKTGELPLNHAYLDSELYSRLEEKGISALTDNNSITKVVKECLHWYKIGLEEEELPSAKLLNFVTILESALKRKGEQDELKQRVADRCALLLASTFEDRKKIVTNITEIYKLRSKVVHTGAIIEDTDFAELAGAYARAVLIELIQKNSEYGGNFERFIDDIDDKKYL